MAAMPLLIEDYALIGDCHTAALVGRDGSIDWLCLPRFDSGACFAALLGSPEHGRWLLAPDGEARCTGRRYRDGTLILETEFETDEGAVRVVDCMPLSNERWDVVRLVEGLRGRVAMRMELVLRFDYGSIVPWVRKDENGIILATAGPDTVELHTPVVTHGEDLKTLAAFAVEAGDCVPFVLNYRPSHREIEPPIDAAQAVADSDRLWREWSDRCTYRGRWQEPVLRSLITLKALTYMPTGGIVAAPTTSLPERLGGVRNWDYRYCWLRDATFTLNSLLLAGFVDEAVAWRKWLLRAVAGSPADLQILYSVTGERRLDEIELGLAARLRRRGAGPGRQRGGTPVPARRLRRGDGHAAPGARRRPRVRAARLGDPARPARVPRHALARARRRHLGDSRRAAPLHPFQGDGLGRVRSRRQGGRALRPRRARRRLARHSRRDPCRGLRRAASTASATPSCSTTARASSTRACC